VAADLQHEMAKTEIIYLLKGGAPREHYTAL
jgi:hypothetical protein